PCCELTRYLLTPQALAYTILQEFADSKACYIRKEILAMRQRLSAFKAEFFKALAHPLRISILDALRDEELTVNEISQRFEVEPANASQQLAILRNKNFVVARKEGASVY